MRADLERAWFFYERGRPEQALEAVAAALAADPNAPEALVVAALVHLALGAPARAVEAAHLAVAAAPEQADPHYALAYVLNQTGDAVGAARAVEETLRLDPTVVRAHLLKGYMALAAGQWARALNAADAGLAHDPADAACQTLAAQALRRLGRLAEADERARLGLANAPESAAAHDTRGWVLLQRGDVVAALAHFEEALRLDPNAEHAREGLLNALRGRYAAYRWFLRGRLRAAYLSVGARLAFVALFIAALYVASHHVPEPWGGRLCVVLVFGALAGYAFSLMADPVMNAILVLHPRGRWALRPHQQLGARVMLGLGLAIAILAPLAYTTGNFAAGYLAAAGVALTFPTAVTFDRRGDRRRRLLGYLLVGIFMLALFPLAAYQVDQVMGLFIGVLIFPICLFFGILGDRSDAHADGV
ncbi:MAG: hypothetical protein JWM80_3490 [Cyanobacteria bacterium RYN_339]|nr:hypothetical protein [Cyanobacteria bacterium RYN_339]